MVNLRVGTCLGVRLSFRCACGPCSCGISNETQEEQDGSLAPLADAPSQLLMGEPVKMPSASVLSTRSSGKDLSPVSRSGLPAPAPVVSHLHLDDEQSTDSGPADSQSETDSLIGGEWLPRGQRLRLGDAAEADRCHEDEDFEDSYFTPRGADRRDLLDSAAQTPVGADIPKAEGFAAALGKVVPDAAEPTPAAASSPRGDHGHDCLAVPPADWWGAADTAAVAGLAGVPSMSRLLGVDVVRHPSAGTSRAPKRLVPWSPGQSQELYERLGASHKKKSYVLFWLNLGELSLASAFEVVDPVKYEQCLADSCLAKRIKLLIHPVKCSLPFPAKGPKEADTVGTFFGSGASCVRTKSCKGVDHAIIQVDLFSKWLLRMALQKVGFREGNVVDIILVDWPGQAVVAATRLSVTESFVQLGL